MRSTLLIATFVTCFASLQAPVQAANDRAEILGREGVELTKKGKNSEGLTRLRAAYDTAHTPRAAAQLGLCEAAVERWVEADVHLTESLLSTDPWIERNRSILQSTSESVRSHLVTIRVTGKPAGAAVR